MTESTSSAEKVIVKRITTNEWVKDLNSINKDKIEGSFKSSDGTRAKARLGRGIDKSTGLKKAIFRDDPAGKKEQREMEIALGLSEGELGVNSPFWNDFTVDMEGSETVLRPSESPIDRLKLKLLISKTGIVAEGYDKRTPETEFIILSQTDEAKKANKSRSYKKNAYAAFAKMSHAEMVDVLVALGRKPTGMSAEMVEDALGREIDMYPQKVLTIIEDPKYKAKLHINKLLNMGILARKGKAIIYGETVLGYDLDTTVDFLNDKENKELTEGLNSAYSAKVKMEGELKKV